jgi:oligosaccharyltransferase complex subunit delta (ribophorin II)
LTHKKSKSEIIYIAEADTSKVYKFDLDLGGQIDEFKSKSGDYSLALLLGELVTAVHMLSNLTYRSI